MANFLEDTVVERMDAGRYRATLSPEWAVWGPNGGYVAAIALRAALAESRLPRPTSFQCHFLAVGEFAPITLRVRSLGGSKRAESLAVEVAQGERTLLHALVWTADDGLTGYAHDFAEAPDVPKPETLRGYQDLAGAEYAQWYPIWRHIEGRPLRWREPPAAPHWQTWMRLDEPAGSTREADAIRQLLWLDFPGWNATIAAHAWPFRWLTPNLDLTVQFHAFAPEVEWLLADGVVPLATDGLVGCTSRLWTEDGRLVASGTSKHICRPNPSYEADLARARDEGLA